MITQYLLHILGYHVEFTCYCILIECSRPIRCFKVILMYNNSSYYQNIKIKRHTREVGGGGGWWLDATNRISTPTSAIFSSCLFIPKGPFTQAIFVAATQCNSMQFLSRRSCNQLRFHCDFSAICQCKRQHTSIPSTKAMCLLKSENTTQSHRVS